MFKYCTRQYITLYLVGFTILWMVIPHALGADDERGGTTHEYQIKAAFLYNFVKLTQWPETAFKHPKAPIRMAIVGPNRFGDAFAPFLTKSIKGRSLEISYHRDFDPTVDCQVVFFSKTGRSSRDQRLYKNISLPVLTVGESLGFTGQGGMINFVMAEKKLRFEINPVAAEQAGLKISSKLLHLATIVGQGGRD